MPPLVVLEPEWRTSRYAQEVEASMTDDEIMAEIQTLVDEEHLLLQKTERGEVDDHSEKRLHAIEVALAQQWDLLRQRRALRRNGKDPDEATLRDAATIEHFRQ